MEHEGNDSTNCNGAFGAVTKGLLKGLEDWEVGDHSNYYIIENGQNSEKSPGELTCCHSNSSEIPSAKTEVKNSNE